MTHLLQQPSHFDLHILDYPSRIRDVRGRVLYREIVLRLSTPEALVCIGPSKPVNHGWEIGIAQDGPTGWCGGQPEVSLEAAWVADE